MPSAPLQRASVNDSGFTSELDWLPYGLQKRDFQNAMEALYDYFYAVNTALTARGMEWMEFTVRAAAVSNIISDLVQAAVAKYSNGLVVNMQHNGHPDLVPRGMFPNNSIKSGDEGVEIKSTRGRVADTHGARTGWVCQFNYKVDSEPLVTNRAATIVTQIYLARLTPDLYRRNLRKTDLGTHTSTPDKEGLRILREGIVYCA